MSSTINLNSCFVFLTYVANDGVGDLGLEGVEVSRWLRRLAMFFLRRFARRVSTARQHVEELRRP